MPDDNSGSSATVTAWTAAAGSPDAVAATRCTSLLVVLAGRGDHQPVVDLGAERGDALLTQRGLQPLQIDAQAVHLDETAAAADHLVQPIRAAPGDIAGAQCVHGLAERQIGGLVCVTHHHIGPAVDEFTRV